MEQDAVDAGRKEGLTSAEKRELVELRRRGAGGGERDPRAGLGLLHGRTLSRKCMAPSGAVSVGPIGAVEAVTDICGAGVIPHRRCEAAFVRAR